MPFGAKPMGGSVSETPISRLLTRIQYSFHQGKIMKKPYLIGLSGFLLS
jgi:hypothetical protein